MRNECLYYIHRFQRLFLDARFAVYEALSEFFLLSEQFGLNVQCMRSILRRQSFYHVCVLKDAKLATIILSNG